MAVDLGTATIITEIDETDYAYGQRGDAAAAPVRRYKMDQFATATALAALEATITAGLSDVADQLAAINGGS